MKYRIIILILSISLLFLSCMYKNPEKSIADDVRQTWISEEEGRFYLINLETVYQAASKESQGNSLTIHGHEVFRISVYDIESGELAARRKFSRYYRPVVSFSEKGIWLYHEKRGLYSVDSITLKDRYWERDIYIRNPAFSSNFFHCDMNLREQFYIEDRETGNLILTDEQGVRYSLDPETLVLTENENDTMPRGGWYVYNDYLEDEVEIHHVEYTLEGDLRKSLAVNGSEVPQQAFIKGYFLLSENDREYILGNNPKETMESLYLIHGDNITEDAQPQFSRLELTDNGPGAFMLWTTVVPGLYLEPERAGDVSHFRRVFSKGNPSYRYRYYNRVGNHFIFIHQLHAGCIDRETGKLLWMKRL